MAEMAEVMGLEKGETVKVQPNGGQDTGSFFARFQSINLELNEVTVYGGRGMKPSLPVWGSKEPQRCIAQFRTVTPDRIELLKQTDRGGRNRFFNPNRRG